VANTPDVTKPCLDAGPVQDDALLPANPYYALRYQFGMLLGVEDFEAAQAYPRGKVRLHNAWLHGAGVVWGLGVSAPPTSASDPTLRGEIQVDPGLALDPLGHELHLDAAACVNVGLWYAKHKDDAGFVKTTTATGGVTFDAHIEIRFRACLTRQVPAMSEPCDGAGASSTAYSRAFETVEIRLVPGKSTPPTYPYHRLRLLFGIDTPATPVTPAEQEVLTALTTIAAKPAGQQAAAFLAAFRRFAALDEIDRQPAKSNDGTRTLLFPGEEDAPVILADLNLQLEPALGGAFTLTRALIDPTVRPTHVATSTIQELNLWAAAGAATPTTPSPPPTTADAGGPRIDRASVTLTAKQLTMQASLPFDPPSVDVTAFTLTQLDPSDGWSVIDIRSVTVGPSNTLKLDLKDSPRGAVLRLIARGTGPEPLVGTSGVPLAGAIGGPPGSAWDGNDFVHMWRRS
jgi:hypothetical protein